MLMMRAYERAKTYSEGRLDQLRAALKPVAPSSVSVLTFGSYARREASDCSDIDYVVVTDQGNGDINPTRECMQTIFNTVQGIVPIEPSADGAFGQHVARADMLRNLGGQNDTNHTLTRRLLLLLEGEWLTGEAAFVTFRQELISRYVHATERDHQLALFLLNDVIRYWRTMTVDYMYKTTEDAKPWAIRNIKLVFSRKLMYASGLFSIALTVDRSESEKVRILENLLSLPVIERMSEICGSSRIVNLLKSYDLFLERLEDPRVRDELKVIKQGDHSNATFRELKNEGHHFTRELMNVFEGTFPATHPIHRAVLF